MISEPHHLAILSYVMAATVYVAVAVTFFWEMRHQGHSKKRSALVAAGWLPLLLAGLFIGFD